MQAPLGKPSTASLVTKLQKQKRDNAEKGPAVRYRFMTATNARDGKSAKNGRKDGTKA